MNICEVCGKEVQPESFKNFFSFNIKEDKLHYFCSYNCMNEWSHRRENNMGKEFDTQEHTISSYEIKDSGKRSEFETGAVRDIQTGKGRFDLLPWDVITDLAIHFEKGSLKYGDNNWRQGIPLSRFIDSGIRHFTKFIMGVNDGEDHLIAAIWNFACLRWTYKQIIGGKLPKSLNDCADLQMEKK